MKKLLALFAIALLLASPFAFATKATQASLSSGIVEVDGIGDLSSGETVEVDSSGNLAVELKNDSNTGAIDSNGNVAFELFDDTNQADIDSDGAVEVMEKYKSVVKAGTDEEAISTPATIYGLILQGEESSSIGDYAVLYNNATANSNYEMLDVTIDSAKGCKVVSFPGGIYFSRDVYVDLIDTDVQVYLIYE